MEGAAALTGLDTNVLLRYLLVDDAEQHAAATRLIDSLTIAEPGFLPVVVLCELVWTLTRMHGFRRADIVKIVAVLLGIGPLEIERSSLVSAAFELFQNTNADFSDCYIAVLGNALGCEYTMTFDRKASRLDGMRLLR